MGTIGVAQNGPQQTVFWQVRATLIEGVYKVTVKINGQVVDDKPAQSYPPHGSVALKTYNSQGLPSGGLFSISGTFSPPNDDPQEFYIQCLLA